MATGLASVAGATAALVASSGVVHAGVREGTVTISTDPNYLMNYSINGDNGPGGQGYQDYMQPIKVNGEIVYCVEPHVLIDSGAQVTNAIPLSQGATLRKPGGSYHVDGKRLIAAAFVDWFLFNGSNSDIDKTIATANATQAGLGDKMRKFRDAIHTLDGGQRLFLMQNFYWTYASNKQVDIEMNSNASSQLMIDYWNKTLTLGGGPTIDGKQYSYYGVALQLASFYQQMDGNGEAPAAYNNDGYILETGGNQQLFSHASFTPKDKPTKPQQPQQPNTVALELYKRSTMGALDIAKSNGKVRNTRFITRQMLLRVQMVKMFFVKVRNLLTLL